MSSVISKNMENYKEIFTIPQLVLIRAFMGEPVVLKCLGIENFSFIILGKDEKKQILLKKKYVYQYDENVYQKLKGIFDSGDFEKLTNEWDKVGIFNFPESKRDER